MITPEEIKKMIVSSLPDAKVAVSDMLGTGDHFDITVEAAQFAKKSLIDQHKMIYDILKPEMDKRIHAVQLKTIVK